MNTAVSPNVRPIMQKQINSAINLALFSVMPHTTALCMPSRARINTAQIPRAASEKRIRVRTYAPLLSAHRQKRPLCCATLSVWILEQNRLVIETILTRKNYTDKLGLRDFNRLACL